MSTFYTTASPQGVSIYATASLFPPTGYLGQLAEAADTQDLYAWNGSAWEVIASPIGFSGVTSLNALTGALTLVAGTDITITPSGSSITIASTGANTALSNLSNVMVNTTMNINGNDITNAVTLGVNYIQPSEGGITLIDLANDGNNGLFDYNGFQSVAWFDRGLVDVTGSFIVVDWANARLTDNFHVQSLNWNTRTLTDNSGTVLADWNQGLLTDGGQQSIDWASRIICFNNGSIAIDYDTPGAMKFQHSNEGTAGYVWTSTDTVGSGTWAPPSSSGANTTLSNLTSPTAINQNLIFATGANATLQTQDSASATAKDLIIRGGNVSGGVGNGGNVLLKPGSSAGGTAGFVQFQPSGFAANPGYIITQATGSTGNMAWTSLSSAIDNGIAQVQGDILYRNATNWVALPPGTAGQVLITGGASANPSWSSSPTLSGTANTVTFFNGSGVLSSSTTFGWDGTTLAPQGVSLTGTAFNLAGGASSGGGSTAGALNLSGGANSSSGTGGNVNITGGNSGSGSTAAGNLILTTGENTFNTAIRGTMSFRDGSEGTSGQVWTSTNTTGAGKWANYSVSPVTTRSVTTTYTVDSITPDYQLGVNTSGGAFTVTLPAPTAGRVLKFKDITGSFNANNLTIAPHSTEMIEGLAANYIVTANWADVELTEIAGNWYLT